jgi:hypothetical protein
MKDRTLSVGFDETSLTFSRIEFLLGDGITDFAALHKDVYVPVLNAFKESFLTLYFAGATYDDTLILLAEKVAELSIINPYFSFYMDNFALYLMLYHGFDQRELIPTLVEGFLLNGKKGLRNIDAVNPKHGVNSGYDAFIQDLELRQMRLKEDFEAISCNSGELMDFNPLQRLYLISIQGRNYLSGNFRTSLAPDLLPIPKGISKVKSALLDKKADIVEMVNIETIDDLIGYELFHTLKQDLIVLKCKFCSEYFIVRGRSDTEYCERTKAGESKPCNIIGATKTYWDGKKDDSIHREFQQAYKRNHSRRRTGTMSASDFFHWSEEARAKLKECEAGSITLDDYIVWLGNKK